MNRPLSQNLSIPAVTIVYRFSALNVSVVCFTLRTQKSANDETLMTTDTTNSYSKGWYVGYYYCTKMETHTLKGQELLPCFKTFQCNKLVNYSVRWCKVTCSKALSMLQSHLTGSSCQPTEKQYALCQRHHATIILLITPHKWSVMSDVITLCEMHSNITCRPL